MTDYEKTGRPASWDKAEPFLQKALTEVDEANPRSVDSAQKNGKMSSSSAATLIAAARAVIQLLQA